jgi:spore coat polysaccharide biosynthesis predicted glycosyltransferase SpsG
LARPPIEVAFRVAAGPRIGFGHLVRALHLAEALGVPARVSIRGIRDAAETARRLGATLLPAMPEAAIGAGLGLLVIDDPSGTASRPWLRAARRAGVPVASIHDVGIAPLTSDLAVDGSLDARRIDGLGRDVGACRLGPAYAVLAPAVARLREARPGRAARPTVVIGLGGGRHAHAGLGVARHLRQTLDSQFGLSRVRVLLSLGLATAGLPAGRGLLHGVELIPAPRFRAALARATVAVVAGGTTLYEACALGTPVVAVPVVPGQATTIRRFVRAGLVVTAGAAQAAGVGSDRWSRAAAAAALDLLANEARQRDLSRRGRQAIDGRGAERVADAITRLLGATTRTTKKTWKT